MLRNLHTAHADPVSPSGAGLFLRKLYRQRWALEQAFNEFTIHLCCELNTLGYPKAVLLAFCVAAISYNVLAALQGVPRGVHREKKVDHCGESPGSIRTADTPNRPTPRPTDGFGAGIFD